MSSTDPTKKEEQQSFATIEDFRRHVLYDESAVAPPEEQKGLFKFVRKAKDNPMVPIGIAGGLSALFYSAYKFKNRDPTTKLSVYLIHTRMAAQGAVVSALMLGVLYSMYKEYVVGVKAESPKIKPSHPH